MVCACEQRLVPYRLGHQRGGAVEGAVETGNFHLQHFIGLVPIDGPGVCQERYQAALEGAEAALDLAFGLGRGCDQMGHAQSPQGALELALGVAVIAAGTRTEEAQRVGVDGLGDPVILEEGAEVAEVVPSGVGGHKTPAEVEARVIIDGEQQDLLGRGRPPLVDGAIVLPEFANMGAAEASVGPVFARAGGHQMGEVRLDVGFDVGAGAFEPAEPLKLIGYELIVRRTLQGQEAFQKGNGLCWPWSVMAAATGLRGEVVPITEELGSQFVEPGAAHTKVGCRSGSVQGTRVELAENLPDKFGRQAMDELCFFTLTACSRKDCSTRTFIAVLGGAAPKPLEFSAWSQWA